MTALRVEPLTAPAFAPFGELIAIDAASRHYQINAGQAERYHDLARIDVAQAAGRALLNIFRAQPQTLPIVIRLLERHPLGSQLFMPLSPHPYLVVVAPPGSLDLSQLRAFLAPPGVGVNYARGTWHHPLLALEAVSDFLVIDRGGDGDNLDERHLASDDYRHIETLPS